MTLHVLYSCLFMTARKTLLCVCVCLGEQRQMCVSGHNETHVICFGAFANVLKVRWRDTRCSSGFFSPLVTGCFSWQHEVPKVHFATWGIDRWGFEAPKAHRSHSTKIKSEGSQKCTYRNGHVGLSRSLLPCHEQVLDLHLPFQLWK